VGLRDKLRRFEQAARDYLESFELEASCTEAYSPKCLEEEFCELLLYGILRSSPRHFLAPLFATL
jgi:hypothetical protein